MLKKFLCGKIVNFTSNGLIKNAQIPYYDFSIDFAEEKGANVAISKKGGHIIYASLDRKVEENKISQEEAGEKAKEFLETHEFTNMKETYYMKEENIVTINYAYEQEGVIMYPDLIKVKVALDDGEILGIETTGYLNSHTERELVEEQISLEEARENINENLEITSERKAVIPTKWKSEILCYEFQGKVNDKEFLVYVNVETGREEDILVILNTPGGTLTT